MARYIAVQLDNDKLSDQEAMAILSDFVADSEQNLPGELSDVIIIELGYRPMASGSRTWTTPYLIRTSR